MSPARLIVIVAESALRTRLIEDIKRLGASGYTETDSRGEGSRGQRTTEWEGQNVRLEALVAPETAEKIAARVQETYLPHYAIVMWVQDVQVLRAEKYV